MVRVLSAGRTSRARGSFCLKVGFAQEGFPSSTAREAGDAALPRSTPCSMSLQLKSMPPMLYRTWPNHCSLQEGSFDEHKYDRKPYRLEGLHSMHSCACFMLPLL